MQKLPLLAKSKRNLQKQLEIKILKQKFLASKVLLEQITIVFELAALTGNDPYYIFLPLHNKLPFCNIKIERRDEIDIRTSREEWRLIQQLFPEDFVYV